MSDKINNANQQIPSYSGITINITNPAINPPAQNTYYCTNPKEISCLPQTIDNNKQEQNVQLLTQGSETAPVYINKGEYLEPVADTTNYENANSGKRSSVTETTGNNNQNVYNDSRTINQYITQPKTDNNAEMTQTVPQGYPAGYYVNNYGEPLQYNAAQQTENNIKEENMSEKIIEDLDKRAEEERDAEKNGKATKIVALTNEYIMSLENYLNNPNKEIRLTASKEIIKRLNEDRSRYDDAALNALLNKMLQDPEKLIRIAAMSALSSELASGNEYTVQLLKQIQQNPQSDPDDVLVASEILLKRASMTEIRYVKQNNQQAEPQTEVVKSGKESKEVEN